MSPFFNEMDLKLWTQGYFKCPTIKGKFEDVWMPRLWIALVWPETFFICCLLTGAASTAKISSSLSFNVSHHVISVFRGDDGCKQKLLRVGRQLFSIVVKIFPGVHFGWMKNHELSCLTFGVRLSSYHCSVFLVFFGIFLKSSLF